MNGGDVGRGLWTGSLGGAFGAGAGAGVGKLLGGGGGFVDGLARGALSGGATGGVNAALSGQDIGRGIWQGAAIGGAIGGTFAGIEARKAGVSFFTGKGRFDLSNGFGAYNLPDDIDLKNVYRKYKGTWNGTNIFESKSLGTYNASKSLRSGGMTLPGRGIYVGKGVYSRNYDLQLLMHEFGHIFQARAMGNNYFYTKIAPSSLISATKATYGSYTHSHHWTEIWANHLAYDYFIRSWSNPFNWNTRRFPLNP